MTQLCQARTGQVGLTNRPTDLQTMQFYTNFPGNGDVFQAIIARLYEFSPEITRETGVFWGNYRGIVIVKVLP